MVNYWLPMQMPLKKDINSCMPKYHNEDFSCLMVRVKRTAFAFDLICRTIRGFEDTAFRGAPKTLAIHLEIIKHSN